MRNSPSLSSLRVFLRVARTLSFTETARAENLSQPALSRTIRLLEAQLGVKLFDRDTRNVALTPSGEELLVAAQRLTDDFDHAFSELAQSFSGRRGRVVVGALPSIAAGILPRAIAELRLRLPEIEVFIRDDLSGPLLQQLEARQIDFAVTNRPEPSDRIAYTPLLADDYVLVCPAGDAPGETAATWSVFGERPFIAMAPRSSVRLITDAALLQAGVIPRPLFECAHLATVGALVRAGLGVTALPRSTLGLLGPGGLAVSALREPTVQRSIGLACLARRSFSPAATALAAAVEAALAPS